MGEDLLHRIRQVLHDNNLGCVKDPGKHDQVAREILAAVALPEAIGEADTEDLVRAVAEALRAFKFEVGRVTFEMLKVGQAVYLTPEERHQLARAAVNAHQEVARRDDL